MSIFSIFKSGSKTPAKKSNAKTARERLQIIVAHERTQRNGPDFLPLMQKELVEVISKYVKIDQDQVKVELAQKDDCSILELNIALPDKAEEVVSG